MSIKVEAYPAGASLRRFLEVGHIVFAEDPAWIAPLALDIKSRLSPRANPFFAHGEAAIFLATKDGKLVGRCTAQIDREHLAFHKDDTGFFGFFDTINDQEVANALLSRASAWLGARGMKAMRGPYSLSINEEPGLLVDGFEHPPYILMGHAMPYQGALAEGFGLAKEKDLFAWQYSVKNPIPTRAMKAWDAVRDMPEVTIRTIDKRNIKGELPVMIDIFNDAWRENWGFVPPTKAEVDKMVQDLRYVIDPELALMVEIDGKPEGMCIALPNVNEAIADFGGKLGPVEAAKLLWRLKVKGVQTGRMMLLGLRRHLRGVKRYGPLALALCVEIARRGPPRGMHGGELSWTLEDNQPVNLAIRAMGGKAYKRYRIYHKSLP